MLPQFAVGAGQEWLWDSPCTQASWGQQQQKGSATATVPPQGLVLLVTDFSHVRFQLSAKRNPALPSGFPVPYHYDYYFESWGGKCNLSSWFATGTNYKPPGFCQSRIHSCLNLKQASKCNFFSSALLYLQKVNFILEDFYLKGNKL